MIKKNYIILLFFLSYTLASGGFDHGSSTGKGKLQLDFTWNPFNIIKHGQTYVVFGYGLTDNFDIHGYFSDHGNYNNGVHSYYVGLFYQLFETKFLDISSAIGKRNMIETNTTSIFFPQLLYNIKLNKNYTIGGSIVRVNEINKKTFFQFTGNSWYAFDIALFIPIIKYFSNIKIIDDVKIGVGLFRTNIAKTSDPELILPTYSVDIKFDIKDYL